MLTCNLTYTFLASSVFGLYSEGHRATLVTRYDSPEILNVHSLNIHIARVALLQQCSIQKQLISNFIFHADIALTLKVYSSHCWAMIFDALGILIFQDHFQLQVQHFGRMTLKVSVAAKRFNHTSGHLSLLRQEPFVLQRTGKSPLEECFRNPSHGIRPLTGGCGNPPVR